MKKLIKYFYIFLAAIFLLCTLFEIYVYMKNKSSDVGIFYLFFNFFIMFLLISIIFNYDKSNMNIRVSKNIISIIVGIFTSFVLSFVLSFIFKYTDSSYLFNDSIFIVSKIVKPIIYIMLGAVSVLELKAPKIAKDGSR